MALLSLENISVAYDQQYILQDFNLSVEKGSLISLLGPSGCGKTTTLRLIAGFIEARAGKFSLNGKDYTHVPVNKRNFGFVFQSYALFPHLSIYDNVAFGLRLRKVSGAEIDRRVRNILDIVSLSGFEKRFPKELSGGQRQRVAIARALVIEPELLLFDEPLSNLDANLRINMRVEIRRIQQELGITTVYVSHDQEECFSISDQVAIMNKGIIEQLGAPAAIFKYPKTEFVARFIGFTNFITFDSRFDGNEEIALKVKDYMFAVTKHPSKGEQLGKQGAIRPDDVVIGMPDEIAVGANRLTGQVKVSTFLGRSYQYVVETELGNFTVNKEMELPYLNGQEVRLLFPSEKLVLVE
ncbi:MULTISPECIES: ABC transporter ATP-binding protein [unclassified Paenibacillus]|uniref:ABC transporter ATP-binding protein n=1 Tax=unclassified Paenibacillus TaxID=185978 RepID=UPI0027894807|nr:MULTISPECIES: ABC transporter ATP-binding protein [unclassified Paenibacillus]MDQ0900576.1 putative spermidine/putrescine transport system ATP-binding protein [Paenibacillus sp. V4I7]MDQ0920917.1 putative spermidine/putrescine transport system ATP-binding protein [Paenibacillus sp. V4I5]